MPEVAGGDEVVTLGEEPLEARIECTLSIGGETRTSEQQACAWGLGSAGPGFEPSELGLG